MKEKVSQSLIKDWYEYDAGEMCGIQFKSKHIDCNYPDDFTPGTKMALGIYLEYLIFKSVPSRMAKKGLTPRPEYKLSSIKKGSYELDDMTADYREAHRKADLVQEYFNLMNVKVVDTNKYWQNEWGEGTTDVIMSGDYFGGEAVVDCKYTGLLRDRWSKYGFGLENPAQIKHHGVQARQYTILTGLPFYYLLVSSSSEDDTIEFVRADVSDESLFRHREEAIYIREKINLDEQIGFVARPELSRCNECLIKERCSFRTRIPTKRIVNFG